jgi:hypothetical protein
MVTADIVNWLHQHWLQIALSIATYIIASDMTVFGPSVQGTNKESISLLTSNTPSGIKTYIERSMMLARR